LPESSDNDPNKFFHYFGSNDQQNYSFNDPANNPNEKDHFSDLFYKNKLFPGLSGWVTLDKPKLEKNELDLIDINYIREENNENIDFHLKKFFEEDDQFKFSPVQNPVQNPLNINVNARKGPTPLTRNKKSNSGIPFKPNLPSFFENLENSLHEFIENSNLSMYAEFIRHYDFISNLDNYFFIEQQQEHNESNYTFGKCFLNNYTKLIERLKTYHDNKKLDVKLLVQIMSSFSVNLISDLIKFIKLCDKSFCFDVIKSKSSQIKKDDPNFFYNNPMSQQDSSFSMNLGTKENESLFSVESKKNRKGWSQNETEALERILKNYFPNQIPNEIIEDFSKKSHRTVFSIQAKIQKMKKKIQKETENQFIKDEEIKMEGNPYFVKNEIIEISEAEDFMTEHSNIFGGTNSNSNSNVGKRNINMAKGGNKYDISLESMIKIVLKEFPRNLASKSDILTKMEEMFFSKGIKTDTKWKMSTSQLLASCKSFIKIKGTYGLNERNLTKDSLNLLNLNNGNKNELNMKQKLIITVNKMTGKRGNINEITDFYMKYFKEKDLCNDEKKIKTAIQKVLKQYSEFDSSQSKTFYSLNGGDG